MIESFLDKLKNSPEIKTKKFKVVLAITLSSIVMAITVWFLYADTGERIFTIASFAIGTTVLVLAMFPNSVCEKYSIFKYLRIFAFVILAVCGSYSLHIGKFKDGLDFNEKFVVVVFTFALFKSFIRRTKPQAPKPQVPQLQQSRNVDLEKTFPEQAQEIKQRFGMDMKTFIVIAIFVTGFLIYDLIIHW